MADLLISLQGIGNTILAVPALKCLYDQGRVLDMVVSDNGSHHIVKALGILRNVYIYKEKVSFIKNALRLKKDLKDNEYDTLYAMYPNGKRENFLSFYLGKKTRCGIKDREGYWKTLGFLIKEKIGLNKGDHDMLSNIRLVAPDRNPQDYKPYLVIPHSIDEEIKRQFFFKQGNKPLIVIHPFSGQRKKNWAIENYRYICRRLIKEKAIKIIVAGSPRDGETIDFLIRDIDDGVEKFTHDNILYTAALIKRCSLFLGNDSSLMHISSVLKKPTIAIWGFSDYRRTSPYKDNSLIIRKSSNCSPCYSFEHGYIKRCKKDFYCLKELDKERVYDILSFSIERIKGGEDFRDLDFGWVKGIESTQTLYNECKAVTLV